MAILNKDWGDYKMKMNPWVHVVAFTLMAVGALNWGLVGLLNLNLVNMLFGSMPGLEQLVYVLVGLSAVYILATHKDDCKTCMSLMKKR